MVVRVSVRDAARRARTEDARARTTDSFVNFAQNMGVGANNPLSTATYSYNPITRQRVLLEWMYRSSWLAGAAVDAIADDMTRAGVAVRGQLDPESIEDVDELMTELAVWKGINQTIKWGRLYGGSIGVILIKGQDVSTPLLDERVGRDMFRGILPLDRWMVEPTLDDLVTDLGPELGLPKYYNILVDAPALRGQRVHHTRVFRVEGTPLPYYQRIQEQMWGLSVLDRLYDRMIAFDSASTGAAQLVYRCWNRVMSIEGLKEIVAGGGQMMKGLVAYTNLVRQFQGIEGVTLIDAKDKMEALQHGAFGGLSDIMAKFGEHISGAIETPLVRLFGQSPAGLNSSGESDLRNYYDAIVKRQESMLRVPVTRLYRIAAQSLGVTLKPHAFRLEFRSLWQLEESEKAAIALQTVQAVTLAQESGLVTDQCAVKELRQSSHTTGVFTNITDEDVDAANAELPPSPDEMVAQGLDPATSLPIDTVYPAPAPVAGSKPKSKPKGKSKKTKDAADDTHLQATAALHRVHGLDVVVETPKGHYRRGVSPDGTAWAVAVPAHYGYVRGATGADGDQVDCHVGPAPVSRRVWVVDQHDPDTGEFDEHKVMLGYPHVKAALDDYHAAYGDGRGPERAAGLTEMSVSQFKDWLAKADLTVPCTSTVRAPVSAHHTVN